MCASVSEHVTAGNTSPKLTSRDFVIHIPSPSLACLLDDCGNCPVDTGCTHGCHEPKQI